MAGHEQEVMLDKFLRRILRRHEHLEQRIDLEHTARDVSRVPMHGREEWVSSPPSGRWRDAKGELTTWVRVLGPREHARFAVDRP